MSWFGLGDVLKSLHIRSHVPRLFLAAPLGRQLYAQVELLTLAELPCFVP